MQPDKRKNIAIIGSGISGLTCAYLLSKKHTITLFEKNDYIGGHTATKKIEIEGQHLNVDTGFIVYNDWTYPNFIKLLDQLNVRNIKTEMSFSVKCANTHFEYSGSNLNTLFAQRKNLLKPRFYSFLNEIVKFNKQAIDDLDKGKIDKSLTLGDYLSSNNYSEFFTHYYLIPMGSAIWSASENSMMKFPLYFFVRFFKNHGLLNIQNRPQWRVIKNGSNAYVKAILDQSSFHVELNSRIEKIERNNHNVTVYFKENIKKQFDEVILACHSDEALGLLKDSSDPEQEILSALPYQTNDVVLHTDERLLPARKLAWASWNYHILNDKSVPPALTYNMNILQSLQCHKTVCVTLNHKDIIDPKKIIAEYQYAHPSFTLEGIAAQQRWREINGINNTWFCGAYWFNGFHEDGVNSALSVCKEFGVEL